MVILGSIDAGVFGGIWWLFLASMTIDGSEFLLVDFCVILVALISLSLSFPKILIFTLTMPADSGAIWEKAALVRSTRPFLPMRSLTVQTTDLPVLVLVTCSLVPNLCWFDAQVMPLLEKVSPLAVFLPLNLSA